jgi:hypothetical protein
MKNNRYNNSPVERAQNQVTVHEEKIEPEEYYPPEDRSSRSEEQWEEVYYPSEDTLSRSEEQWEEVDYPSEDTLSRSEEQWEEVDYPSYQICEEIASEVKLYVPEDQSKLEEVFESEDEVSSFRPEIYQSKIFVPPRPKQANGYTLYDKYILCNLDMARKLRDSFTQSLTEFVECEIMHRGLFYTYYTYDPPDYQRKSCEVKTAEDFDKCEGKYDLSSLLRFVKKTNKYCPKSIIDEFIVKRNGFCHGLHINSCVGRTVGDITLLFTEVKEILSYLKLDSGEIDKLQETFNDKVEISARANQLKNLTVGEGKIILQSLIENMDDENVRNLISGVIAPRIKNVEYLLGRQKIRK